MSVKINENFKYLQENYLFSEIAKRVNAYIQDFPGAKIIRLGIGDVTRPLTQSVIQALHKATDEMADMTTFRGYAPEYGYDFIRQQVADYYKKFGVKLQADEVFVSDGAKSDLGNIVDIFGNNKIAIPNPVYPVYMDSNLMSGRRIEFMDATAENGFLPLPDSLCEGSYIVYLCSPNNPTGAVYNRDQLKKWIDFAGRTGSVIIFDSAYEAYISGDYPHTIYEIEGADTCAIEICSLSKTAGFTGTRFAWSVFPKNLYVDDVLLSKLWERRQATKFNGVPYVIQRAAEAALSEQGQKESAQNVAYYMQNASLLSGVLSKKNIWFTGGSNSPYIWLKCPNQMTSWQFFDYMLHNLQIVGTPGSGFGSQGEGYFRLTSFGRHEDTDEAVRRFEEFL